MADDFFTGIGVPDSARGGRGREYSRYNAMEVGQCDFLAPKPGEDITGAQRRISAQFYTFGKRKNKRFVTRLMRGLRIDGVLHPEMIGVWRIE